MNWQVILIIVLAFIIGFLLSKLIDKRNSNIIKLLIKKDLLPPTAKETPWLQGAQCFMSDGSVGKTDGNYCTKIQVI